MPALLRFGRQSGDSRRMRVAGKVAIVTGAASGLGRGSARRLAEQGATVILADRDVALGQAAADELGAPHRFATLDVTDEAGWIALVEDTSRRFGRLDILVNAAGSPCGAISRRSRSPSGGSRTR